MDDIAPGKGERGKRTPAIGQIQAYLLTHLDGPTLDIKPTVSHFYNRLPHLLVCVGVCHSWRYMSVSHC